MEEDIYKCPVFLEVMREMREEAYENQGEDFDWDEYFKMMDKDYSEE